MAAHILCIGSLCLRSAQCLGNTARHNRNDILILACLDGSHHLPLTKIQMVMIMQVTKTIISLNMLCSDTFPIMPIKHLRWGCFVTHLKRVICYALTITAKHEYIEIFLHTLYAYSGRLCLLRS